MSRRSQGRSPRVLVVGDVMLDEFLIGSAARLSPEAPVPVVHVGKTVQALGGAANAAAGSAALGAGTSLVGVVGDDASGERVRALLGDAGVNDDCLVDRSRPTTTKTRVVAAGQQIARLDHEATHCLDAHLCGELSERAASRVLECDAVIISDYRKGSVMPAVATAVLRAAASRGIPVVVDTKATDWAVFAGATVFTPNHHEAAAASGVVIDGDQACDRAGQEMIRRSPGSAVLITRGPNGMSLYEPDGSSIHLPSLAREVFDVTGAGDAVVSTLAVWLAAGSDLVVACRAANAAAGIVVAKRGTATVSAEELRAAASHLP